ncbi:hypothetical protein JVT61DRAFT_12430 [Boletus reticuloceps]|uniref:Uncharacterized protein n=1 Tax=Boletus reticuloceps TaxID=495285 RepID=A0A8I3A4V8_9AGAM|nr:hypothetical protein JVT61DRAFT_12430 [Boletus reticuloceps]
MLLPDEHIPSSPLPVLVDLRPLTSSSRLPFRARFQTGGVVYSRSSTHLGNSLILFYPTDSSHPIPGCIKYIFEDGGCVWFAVHCHPPARESTIDPYRHYPYFPARLYAADLSNEIELVSPSQVLSHIVRWRFSEESVVVLALTMVCNHFYSCTETDIILQQSDTTFTRTQSTTLYHSVSL